MKDLRVEYLYNGNPYRFSRHIFDTDHLLQITKNLQKKYSPFADRINQKNGYLELNISHSKIFENGIHYEAFILAVSKELIEELNAWECSQSMQSILV